MPDEALFQTNVDFLNVTNATQGVDKLPASLTFASVYDTSIAKEAMQRL